MIGAGVTTEEKRLAGIWPIWGGDYVIPIIRLGLRFVRDG